MGGIICPPPDGVILRPLSSARVNSAIVGGFRPASCWGGGVNVPTATHKQTVAETNDVAFESSRWDYYKGLPKFSKWSHISCQGQVGGQNRGSSVPNLLLEYCSCSRNQLTKKYTTHSPGVERSQPFTVFLSAALSPISHRFSLQKVYCILAEVPDVAHGIGM